MQPQPHAAPGHRALQPTRIQAAPLGLVRVDRAALAELERVLHPALAGVRRFVDALLSLSPHAARRLGTTAPEVWAAIRAVRGEAQVVGLGWLAGEATEVLAAPGRDHDEATTRLVDVLLASAHARRLRTLTARVAGPFHASTAFAGSRTRLVAVRDGATILQLDLTLKPEPDHVAT